MTDDDLRKAMAICDAATEGKWKAYAPGDGRATKWFVGREVGCGVPPKFYIAFLPDMEQGDSEADAAFIAAAHTGWPAALEENATWQREFAVLQAAYLKLLEVGRAWRAKQDSTVCDASDLCDDPGCALAALIDNAEPCLPHSDCDGKRQGD